MIMTHGSGGTEVKVDVEPLSSAYKSSELFSLLCCLPLIFGRQKFVPSRSVHLSRVKVRKKKVGSRTPERLLLLGLGCNMYLSFSFLPCHAPF